MLTIIRDPIGRIDAAVEWTPVDTLGTPSNTGTGAWVWINQAEFSHGIDSRTAFREIMAVILLLIPWAVGAYWQRRDRTGRSLHSYTRTQFHQYIQKEVTV